MFEDYLKSKKYIVAGVVTVAGIILLSYLSIRVSTNNQLKKWEPLVYQMSFEYGDYRQLTKQDFIRTTDDVELIDIDINIPTTKNDKGDIYYQMGVYNGILKVKVGKYEQDHNFVVSVKDTKAPSIVEFNERIVVGKGYSGDFREFFKFDDVDDFRVSIDTHFIDTNIVGTYHSIVEAIDNSKNTTRRDFIVDVVDGSIVPAPPIIEDTEDGQSDSVSKTTSDIKQFEDIQYSIKRIADPNSYEGQENVHQKGVLGSREKVTRVYYENNIEVKREVISETVVKAPVDEIVYYGTKPVPIGVEGAFGEMPLGLVLYETPIIDDQLFGKEYYEFLDDAYLRGEDLLRRNLIASYQQGSVTRNGVKYYYIIFELEKTS